MKRSILLLLMFTSIISQLSSQTWNLRVEKQAGKHKVKTLALKPGMPMEIGRFLSGNDSVNESRYFKGYFWSGKTDSLVIKLKSVKSVSYIKDGPVTSSTVPAALCRLPLNPDSTVHLALQDVDYLFYSRKDAGKFDPTLPLLLGSIAAMIAAPLISYDYKAHEMNAKRLQYWGFGCTIGMACGVTSIFTASGRNHHRYQFRPEWPNKFAKHWEFR